MHHTPSVTKLDFQQVFNNSPNPCALLSPELTIVACNEAYEHTAGIARHAMLSRPLFEIFPAEHNSQRETLEASFDYVRRRRQSHQIPLLHYSLLAAPPSKNQYEDRYWTISNIPLLGEDGELRLILHYPTDITELTHLRRANDVRSAAIGPTAPSNTMALANRWAGDVRRILQTERERLQQLFQQAPGFICVLRGPQHIYELANDAYYQLIGHRQVLGCALAEVLPEVIEQGYLDKLDRVFATGEPFIGRALPIQLQRSPGAPLEQRYIDLVYQPVGDHAGQISGIFVQGHDVTETHKLAQEISYQAAHDSLTGLYNRREFARQVQALEELPGPHALLYMDLDHFKIINDRCGHAAGDALLLQVVDVLRQHINDTDVLARLGGDEFALILPKCPEDKALERAHLLRCRIRDILFSWDARRYSVTLSSGVSGFGGPHLPSFAEALSLADAACFLAKEKGRDRVQVSRLDDEDVNRQRHDMDWADRLKECIQEDRVVLYGQRIRPIHANKPDALELQEILARLHDTEGNLVSPTAFIPAAERFGLIDKLDHHIIRKAFSKLQSLPASLRARTRYFINVSGITLSTPGLSVFLRQLLLQYCDVRPRHVCFEVTETAAISSLPQTASTIRELTHLGFQFALDDFGSGMSSFAYLDQLPVQYVKIDGEFIKGIMTRKTGAAIVEAVSKIARTMNILTIAESIEALELLPYLQELGIDYGQGFALHRPEPL